MSATGPCSRCGAIVADHGTWKMNLSQAYDNGARYPRGRHTEEQCAKVAARNAATDEANRAYREAEAKRDAEWAFRTQQSADRDAHLHAWVDENLDPDPEKRTREDGVRLLAEWDRWEAAHPLSEYVARAAEGSR